MSEFEKVNNEENKLICWTPGCGKEAKMACPTCIKLGAPPSRFCDQECFKKSWNEHKKVHEEIRKIRDADPAKMPGEFKYYRFTGPLRPWKVTPKSEIPADIEKPDYADHPDGSSACEEKDRSERDGSIRVYTPEEIEGIRAACMIGREVLEIGEIWEIWEN